MRNKIESRKWWKVRNFLNALKVAWAITLATLFGNQVSAQWNAVRDNATHNIEQTLKIWWKSGYWNIIKQRDILLESYSLDGRDVYQDFINTQKSDFLRDYKNNNYNIKSYVNQIKQILSAEFGIDIKSDDPVLIITKALQVISNEEYETYLWFYTQKLTWQFDMNFINAYGYIQAQTPSSWTCINWVYMPNRELDKQSWAETLKWMIKKLNDWSYWTESISWYTNYTWNVTNIQPSAPVSSTNNSTTNVTHHTTNYTTTNTNTVTTQPEVSTPTTNNTNSSDIDLDIDVDDKPVTKRNEWTVWVQTDNKKIQTVPVKQESVQPTAPKVEEEKSKLEPEPKIEPQQEKKNAEDTDKTDWQNPEPNVKKKINNSTDIDLDLTPDMFYDENLEIINSKMWNAEILSKKLNQENLNWITYEQILSTVNWFKDVNLQKAVMYSLLNNDVMTAQKLLWMSPNCNDYQNYKAWTRLWATELQKMANQWKTRMYLSETEVMWSSNIPQDVKNVYKKFISWELSNNGKDYAIVSKDDYRIYLFSQDHHLLARQNVLLWADKWDQKNNPAAWSQTTPGGKYEVWNRFTSNWNQNFFAKYWSHYIVLLPSDWQYTYSSNYTMWIHWDYKWSANRKTKLYSSNSIDHRASNGCINVDSDLFGEIYNHLETGWVLYVAYE